MDASGTAAIAESLGTLRKEGLAAAGIPDDSPLLLLDVTLRSAPSGASPDQRRAAFRDLLPLVIETDIEGRDVLICRALFATQEWEGFAYGERIDAIEKITGTNWETSFRKEPLRRLLKRVTTALIETEVELASRGDDQPRFLFEIPRLLISLRYESGPDARRATLESRTVRAIAEGVSSMAIQARVRRLDAYGSDPEIQLFGADDLVTEDITRSRDGDYYDSLYTYRVSFGRALKVEEELQFAIVRTDETPLRFPGDGSDVGWLSSIITVSPGEFEAQVTFPADHLPPRSWWFAEVMPTAQPPQDPRRRIALRGRTLAYPFPRAQLGHRYGITWEFDENDSGLG